MPAIHRHSTRRAPSLALLLPFAILSGCANAPEITGTPAEEVFKLTELGSFDEPWAMTFLPDGRLLITEKSGHLQLRGINGALTEVTGLPDLAYGGQGGLGDVQLHPQFASNATIYLSYAEADLENDEHFGAAVARARLIETADAAKLESLEVIWRQSPKVEGRGHYGHRVLLGADGKLWISSGDRQKFDPAQDMSGNLGKILRLNDNGTVPADNPFAEQGGVTAQIWSLGHRNPLGLAFDQQDQLWNHEMGPAGGDELNLVERGANYGYPIVSNGDHYDGREIPDHRTRPEFKAPEVWWTPVISPGGMVIYSGQAFPAWRGHALIAGLSSQALVRVEFTDKGAKEVERYAMGARIREVEQASDGSLWVLEDGSDARLLRLEPRRQD